MTQHKVSTISVVFFAAPSMVTSVMHGQTSSAIPSIYATYFDLDLALIGTVLLLARIVDALTDPVIGYFSDRTMSAYGRRKPWIAVGCALAIPALLFYFIPQQGVSIAYFAFWYVLIYVAWTIIEVPTTAWQVELSSDYRTRNKISIMRFFFASVGGMCFFMAPLLPFFSGTEFTPEVLRWIAVTVAVLLPLLVAIQMRFVPKGVETTTRIEMVPVVEAIRDLYANRPARIIFFSIILLGTASGIYLSAFFLYVNSYMGYGDKISYLWAIPAIASIAVMPAWLYLCNRFDRHRVWSVAAFIGAFLTPTIFLLEPGSGSYYPLLILFSVLAILNGASSIAAPGIVGDTIDFHTLKTGENRTAQIQALSTIILKVTMALGTALGFYILTLFGFDATSSTQSETAALGIKLSLAVIPGILYITNAAVISIFPIDKRRQSIIKRRLDSRAARAARHA